MENPPPDTARAEFGGGYCPGPSRTGNPVKGGLLSPHCTPGASRAQRPRKNSVL